LAEAKHVVTIALDLAGASSRQRPRSGLENGESCAVASGGDHIPPRKPPQNAWDEIPCGSAAEQKQQASSGKALGEAEGEEDEEEEGCVDEEAEEKQAVAALPKHLQPQQWAKPSPKPVARKLRIGYNSFEVGGKLLFACVGHSPDPSIPETKCEIRAFDFLSLSLSLSFSLSLLAYIAV
jgi:hypothetical protein